MHCNDEDLVAYLDGELQLLRRFRIQRHLEACWPCRTRLAAAELTIQQLTKQVDRWSYPQPGWTLEGKRRLSRSIRDFESRAATGTPLQRSNLRPRMWSATAATAVAAILFILWPQRVKPLPIAADAILRAAAVESVLYTRPVQQTLAVEIRELRPIPRTRSTRLEVWADSPSGRFASKWVSNDGVLRHAVWKSGRGSPEFLYSPALASIPVKRALPSAQSLPLSSLADYGLDSAQIESAFLRWLETAAGRAVSFTSDLAVWSHQDGTAMKAELLQAEGASPAIRVTAQRTAGTMTAVLLVDFDADSYRPRLQTIRFETVGRAIEFRIAATQIRNVSSRELKSSLFAPELRSFGAHPVPDLRISTEQSPLQTALPSSLPDASLEKESQMLEAHYVLHQAGACLGEPVKIEHQGDGIRVQNRGRRTWSQSFTSSAPLEVVLSAFADLRSATPPAPDSVDGADTGFGSVTALRHAWALSRLARHFHVGRTEKFLPEHWRLLEIMLRDHVTSIDSELERVHLQQDQDTHHGRQAQSGWRYSSSILFESLLNAGELLSDEPIAKVVPLLQEIDAELHKITVDFSSEYLRSQVAGMKHAR